MKIYSLILAIFIFSIVEGKASENVFTLFFRNYPAASKSSNVPTTMATKNNKAGLVLTSGGYLTISNKDGQVTFPRTAQKDQFRIVVTKEVKPVFLNKGTIRYWILTGPARVYNLRKRQGKETKLYFWEAKKGLKPKDNKIPLHTMVILANPEKIYIPEGVTPSAKGTQLYLPDIYVKDGIETVGDAIYSTQIRQYFSPILNLYAGVPKGYLKLIKPLTHTNPPTAG